MPRFADISQPLTALTKKDIPYEWTQKCQDSFDLFKKYLIESPILKYPDPEKPYTLFTDANKYAWACVLTQAYDHIIEGKERTILHPFIYMSGLFWGSQLNWAALTEEVYAIYVSVKKLSFYLDDADITLRSDHLTLKRILEENTLNSKVNNWAVEIEHYQIQFEYDKGIKNPLADTMSRLIVINPHTYQDPEPEGQEYGYSSFEELPNVSTIKKVSPKANVTLNEITVSSADSGTDLQLNITCERCQLQQDNLFCKRIRCLLKSSKLQTNSPYYMEE